MLDLADLDAHRRERVVRFFVRMRCIDQGFGGNAAPIEAHAADVFLLDANGFYAELPEPDRADIAARAATNDDCVVGFHRSSILDPGGEKRPEAAALQRARITMKATSRREKTS